MSDADATLNDASVVTVCASCLTAACWQGRFCCDEYRTADVVEKTVAELIALGQEHPSNWTREQ